MRRAARPKASLVMRRCVSACLPTQHPCPARHVHRFATCPIAAAAAPPRSWAATAVYACCCQRPPPASLPLQQGALLQEDTLLRSGHTFDIGLLNVLGGWSRSWTQQQRQDLQACRSAWVTGSADSSRNSVPHRLAPVQACSSALSWLQPRSRR